MKITVRSTSSTVHATGQQPTCGTQDRLWSPTVWVAGDPPVGHPNDRGARMFDGILYIDGFPHCPATPEDLHTITRPPRFTAPDIPADADPETAKLLTAQAQALTDFDAKIAQRSHYAMRRHTGAKPDGSERFECPTEAYKIRCPLKPFSANLPDDLPTVDNPPAVPGGDSDDDERPTRLPVCCTQQTSTAPGDHDAKRRQRLPWGGIEWKPAYNRRTYAEAAYG